MEEKAGLRKKYIILFIHLVFCIACQLSGYAQNVSTVLDTIPGSIADTTKNDIYSNIHTVANKRKWTKILYDFIFDYSPPKEVEIAGEKSIDETFSIYSGKRIRKIDIICLSPFGTNINNPDSIKQKSISNTLNSLHKNTFKFIIHGNLLFKEGDLVNPFTFAENEAYLRDMRYVSDARIQIMQTTDDDWVDIVIIVRDKFSLGFNIRNVSFSKYDVELYDRNFAGLGSELILRFMNNKHQNPPIGYGASFINPNFFHTFICTELSYLKSFDRETLKIAAERAIQPSLKYFGGLSYSQQKLPYRIDLVNDTVTIRNETLSATAGRVINLSNSRDDSKLVVASRFLWQNDISGLSNNSTYNYLNYPFERKYLWITSLSLYQQRYYRRNMIYNFGNTEDIAYGYNASAQIGYEDHAYFNRIYGSVSLAGGNLFKIGYLYTKASYGSYFRNGRSEQGVLRFYSSYFSSLINLRGKSYFRQFASIDYTEGIRRLNAANEFIYFSRLTNFNTSKYNLEANGIRRFMINTESNWFNPFTVLGFRAVLFVFTNFAWLGHKNEKLFHHDNFFSGYGIGIRTRNDQLVFKTIQIKLAWYPQLNQNKFSDYYNFSSSDPNASPNFKPDYPDIIPFE
ncbi:MAG: hypothetical protein LBL90_04830 [Prevotellaceae bacterium]|nr:hypothetical protein [Prevotellaceae bacterium]